MILLQFWRFWTAAAVSLTGSTVLARPAGEAVAEVSSNQVSAGAGVDTRVVVALVGV